MDLLAHRFNAATISIVGKNNRVAEIGCFISFLGINSNKVKLFPDLFKESIEIEFHVAADNNSIRLLSNKIDFFHGDGINLIETIKAFDILSIA